MKRMVIMFQHPTKKKRTLQLKPNNISIRGLLLRCSLVYQHNLLAHYVAVLSLPGPKCESNSSYVVKNYMCNIWEFFKLEEKYQPALESRVLWNIVVLSHCKWIGGNKYGFYSHLVFRCLCSPNLPASHITTNWLSIWNYKETFSTK